MEFSLRATKTGVGRAANRVAATLLWCVLALWCLFAAAANCRAQESGRQADATFNKGAEIAVMVHDETREPISSTVMVAIYKDGTTPAGQAGTSRGVATFVVRSLGDFTVVVEAAGYRKVVKEISVPTAQRTL